MGGGADAVFMPSHPLTPIISRALPDGTLVETLYDAEAASTSLAIRAPDGGVSVEGHLDLATGERLVPYAARNNLLLSGCVLLPSEVGELVDKSALLAEVQAFIHAHVDLSPLYERIAAHYALLSWVHDAFNEMPYLRFRGDYGSGKTRALLAVGSLCYKPFFASGASTVSPIFHVLDAFGATLLLDEADLRFSDATADLTKILNNGSMKGLPVLRTMTNRHKELNPQAFKVFGPKIVAMRHGFDDEALESRFLTEETSGRPLRAEIALSVPETMKADALALRNKLLAWRFATYHGVAIDPSRAIASLSPRGNQMALPLLSLVDDEALRAEIGGALVAEEARAAAKRAASPEALMARALGASFASNERPFVSLAALTQAYNDQIAAQGGQALTPKAAGWLVRGKLGLETTKTRGVYVVPHSQRAQALKLAARFGLTLDKQDDIDAGAARPGSARSAEKYALTA